MRPGPDPSALYLLVPAAEPLLDAVRDLPGVGLLEPAHVSLGYPWLTAEQALQRLDAVREVVAATSAWEVVLDGPHRFETDVRGRTVVHLRPDDDGPFLALAGSLGAALRTPHLSVARVLAAGSVPDVEQRLAGLLPRPHPAQRAGGDRALRPHVVERPEGQPRDMTRAPVAEMVKRCPGRMRSGSLPMTSRLRS